ncbi:MAG: hypothetical protein ACRD8Z_29295 [Nitrososphaeraceae archaeon]
MTYTLLFGNNFISNSPRSVKCDRTTLFFLGEDSNGPYLTTKLTDLLGEHVLLTIYKNICTYCSSDLVLKKNERNHILVDSKDGENIIQSRILDKTTILVSGMFSLKENVLVVTQNYIVSPSGKRIMHSRISAKNSSVTLTDEEIIPDD